LVEFARREGIVMSPHRGLLIILANCLWLGGLQAAEAPPAAPLPAGALRQLGSTRLRHPYDRKAALHVLYSPDGKTLATRTDANTIRLWDVASGRLQHQMADVKGGVSCFAFAADSRRLATGSAGFIRIWDVSTGKQTKHFPAHEAEVASLAFSPDGQTIVSGSSDGTVRLWDTASGKELKKYGSDLPAIVAVAYAPDGMRIAAAERNSVVHLWDPASGKDLGKLAGDGSRLFAMAFAPDSKTLAVGSKTIIRLWDVANAKELRQLGRPVGDDVTSHNNDVTMAFSADGTMLASAGRRIRLWEVASGNEIRSFGNPSHRVCSVGFSGDGKTLAVGGSDHEIHFWSVATGKELDPGDGHRDRATAVAWSPDGKRIATGGQDKLVLVWDAATGQIVHRLSGHSSGVAVVAFSLDSKLLVSGDRGGMLRIWDSATGKELYQFQAHQDRVESVAFSPTNKYVASGGRDGSLRVYEMARDRETGAFPKHTQGCTAVAFSPDGKRLASGAGDGRIQIWDPALAELVVRPADDPPEDDPLDMVIAPPRPPAPQGPVLLLQFTPDGKRLRFWREAGVFGLWDPFKNKALRQVEGPSGEGFVAAFSPDAKTLAVRDRDNRITLREAATAGERRLLPGHASPEGMAAVAFSPDGQKLVSVCDDSTALIWDTTGRLRDGSLPVVKLTPRDLDAAWMDLAGEDAGRAYQAIWTLTAGAEQALPYIQEKIKPVPVDPKRIERLIADLDSRQFPVRDRARLELEELAELAEEALKKALAAKPALEVQTRLEKLLAKVEKERNGLNPHRLRVYRLTEVLEKVGSEEARKLLEGIAAAPADLRLLEEIKDEAKACLKRLASGGR
jgi:WD40 repeat protein